MTTDLTPYERAYEMMCQHPTTGGCYALAKMILSLYNGDNCYSVRECLDGRDSEIVQVILEMIGYYATHGEDEALRQIGRHVCKDYPRLIDIADAGFRAKCKIEDAIERISATLGIPIL